MIEYDRCRSNLGKLVVTFGLPIWYYITMPAVLAKSIAINFRGMYCSGAKKCLSMFFRVYFVWRTFYGRILRSRLGILLVLFGLRLMYHLFFISSPSQKRMVSQTTVYYCCFPRLRPEKKFHWFVTNRSDLGIGKVYDNDATKYRLRCSTH